MTIRESLRKVLEEAGYEVLLAKDERQAMERFDPSQVDLVFWDLAPPKQTSWEMVKHVASRQPPVPVIVVTGLPNQYPAHALASVGALLEKPLEVPALLNTVEALLAAPKVTGERRLHGPPVSSCRVPPTEQPIVPL